jgi:hypothetical protein
MEWTTFYGHMLTLGVNDYIDWRPVGPGDIHRGIAAVHAHGALAGMAHPFRIGSPICTGCFWEFEISDWNDVDFIEVWSGTFPSVKQENIRAFQLWTDRLNEGYRIAATAGRDWHVQTRTDEPVSVTYLGLDDGPEPVAERALRALAQGRASITIGPLVVMELKSGHRSFRIGDIVPSIEKGQGYRADISVDFSVRNGIWEITEQFYMLRVVGNTGVLAEHRVSAAEPLLSVDIVETGLIWARAELWGIVNGVKALIAFTNAVYFRK